MLLSLFKLSTDLSTTNPTYAQTYPQVKNLINHTNRPTAIPYNPTTPLRHPYPQLNIP
nr:MAG TPA: hypothetical protein [Caudoviricetes sp.]